MVQMALSLGLDDDIAWMREQLRSCLGEAGPILVRPPVGQLVKSLISSRTRDEVSLAAYEQLRIAYPRWAALAEAPAGTIEAVICEVTYPDVKARQLGQALRAIAADHPDFDLAFLGGWSVVDALAWLERLPGVGRKVAASTLNFSTLERPAFVVDTHILRILRRYGMIRGKADTQAAFQAVMARADGWTAGELAEFHVLIKRLGQTICRADQARCGDCPLQPRCRAGSGKR